MAVDHLPELRVLRVGTDAVELGAALSLTELETGLAGRVPLLDELLPQFASRLIRNRATIGGNLGTGSPIGDLAPALLALDAVRGARVGARRARGAARRLLHRLPHERARARTSWSARVRIPLPLAPTTSFQKVAKRRYDDISSVAVALALEITDGVVRRARIGLGGVAAVPLRARATEDALAGRPWDGGTVAHAARVLAEEGSPLVRPPRERRLPLRDAGAGAAAAARADGRAAGDGMTALAARPADAVVGTRRPHESAALHVTGRALYTDDLVGRTKDVLHAWPVQAPHAHARVLDLRPGPALRVPGVVRVLTADDVPGVNDAGVKHDEPLFPGEVMFHGHAVCWVLGETLEAARLGADAVEVDYLPLPSIVTLQEAIAAESFQGGRPRIERGDVEAALERAEHVFSGALDLAGQEHFYLETHCSLALVDENGQVFVQSSTQHPSETQEIVAHVLGLDNAQVTVQCLRMGGGFGGKEMQPHGLAAVAALGAVLTGRPVRLRLNRTQDMTMTGKRHGFAIQLAGRLRRRLPAAGAGRDPHLRRRVEPRPVGAGARPRAVPRRQRLLRAARAGQRPRRADAQDLADGVPRLRRAAGDARRRGRPRPVRAAARRAGRGSCGGATSTSRGRRRRTARWCATRSGSPWRGSGCSRSGDVAARTEQVERFNADARAPQARARADAR